MALEHKVEHTRGNESHLVTDEPATAAGPGATTTTAIPENVTSTEGLGHDLSHKDPDSSASSQDAVDEEKLHDEEQGEVATKEEGQGGPSTEAPIERSKGKIAIIMLALCMAVFLAALDVTIITTALPTISEHFHSSSGYTWIGSAFLLANSASIPSWGKVSDIFGRKPMLLVANVIFMIGSLIAALSTSIGMLIAARAIQGIGGGGLVILVNIVIGDLFSLRNRGAFYGMVGAVWAIASSVGPIIGGAFTQKVSWRWCFYINLPLDGLAFIILFFFLDLKTPRTPIMEGLKAIDWVGSLSIVGGTLMFLFGLQYGGVTDPWGSATVVCLLVFSIVTFALFAFWEIKYAKFPVMPMGLFNERSRLATLGVVFCHGFVFISGSYYLPLYFQAIRGASPLLSGVYLLPTALALAFTSIGTGVFIKKSGMFLPPIYGGMLFLTLGYGLFVDFTSTSGWGKLIAFQIVAGLGIGPLFQAPIIALQAHINPRDIGTATATLGFVRQLATSSSVVIGEVVFQNQMAKKSAALTQLLGPQLAQQLGGGNAGANSQIIDQLPDAQKVVVRKYFAQSLQPMWIMYTCVAAVGIVCALFIRRKVLSAQHEETKTGIEAEKENAAQRAAEREARHESKRQSKRTSHAASDSSRPHSAMPGSRPHTAGGSKEEIPPMPSMSTEKFATQDEARNHTLSTLESRGQ
ncbi:hypothetical protein LTR78_004321 [Recurvomyces mirabilis]|uniref:Efflux pump dotC n=1 Tax=Recurvomyces mirabilis TaxID=574656 RepID=A0AAE0WPV0_9PEZI|nr:hypothetical protein LTR78_004321 [Recurvomyces mirabilis]KAK5156012.1 hypothetical protein LTS14_005578 [Recurvomyces mirabilis]